MALEQTQISAATRYKLVCIEGNGDHLPKVASRVHWAAVDFMAEWDAAKNSENPDQLEKAYSAWNLLQATNSESHADVLEKLAAFSVRFGGDKWTCETLCDLDFSWLQGVASEAGDFLGR